MVYQTGMPVTDWLQAGGWLGDERWGAVRRLLGEWSPEQTGGESARLHGLAQDQGFLRTQWVPDWGEEVGQTTAHLWPG